MGSYLQEILTGGDGVKCYPRTRSDQTSNGILDYSKTDAGLVELLRFVRRSSSLEG